MGVTWVFLLSHLFLQHPRLADDASNVPVDSLNATRENLLRGLAWLVARSAPGDQLFFIFCGHGAQIPVQETCLVFLIFF